MHFGWCCTLIGKKDEKKESNSISIWYNGLEKRTKLRSNGFDSPNQKELNQINFIQSTEERLGWSCCPLWSSLCHLIISESVSSIPSSSSSSMCWCYPSYWFAHRHLQNFSSHLGRQIPYHPWFLKDILVEYSNLEVRQQPWRCCQSRHLQARPRAESSSVVEGLFQDAVVASRTLEQEKIFSTSSQSLLFQRGQQFLFQQFLLRLQMRRELVPVAGVCCECINISPVAFEDFDDCVGRKTITSYEIVPSHLQSQFHRASRSWG